ncbi:E3 ubiquitin protein ligase SINAT2-like protein [Tanacetum coccineum]
MAPGCDAVHDVIDCQPKLLKYDEVVMASRVTGNIPELVTHLKDDHALDMHDGYKFNNLYAGTDTLEMENASWMLSVFNCYGQQFCLHFEAFLLGMAPCNIAFLQFMGEETDAKMFKYS